MAAGAGVLGGVPIGLPISGFPIVGLVGAAVDGLAVGAGVEAFCPTSSNLPRCSAFSSLSLLSSLNQERPCPYFERFLDTRSIF